MFQTPTTYSSRCHPEAQEAAPGYVCLPGRYPFPWPRVALGGLAAARTPRGPADAARQTRLTVKTPGKGRRAGAVWLEAAVCESVRPQGGIGSHVLTHGWMFPRPHTLRVTGTHGGSCRRATPHLLHAQTKYLGVYPLNTITLDAAGLPGRGRATGHSLECGRHCSPPERDGQRPRMVAGGVRLCGAGARRGRVGHSRCSAGRASGPC